MILICIWRHKRVKWYDRASDIFNDFDYRDFLWCQAFVLALGILFGVSANKALKRLTPFIAVFAAFAAFEVFYPRRNKLKKIADGTYEDRLQLSMLTLRATRRLTFTLTPTIQCLQSRVLHHPTAECSVKWDTVSVSVTDRFWRNS